MDYKISFKNQFKALRSLIYGTILYIGLICFLYYKDVLEMDLAWILVGYYLVLFIPVIFLHLEYYLRNRNDFVDIDGVNKRMLINGRPIAFREIKEIILQMPPVWHRRRGAKTFPFESYRYAVIKMKNGEQYIFTCLMAYDLEDTMKRITGIPIGKRKPFIASTLIG